MLEKHYQFKNHKNREKAHYRLIYKRKIDSRSITRRFANKEAVFERIHELSGLGLFSLNFWQKAQSGRFARVLRIRNDVVTWRSPLRQHEQPKPMHVLLPPVLDPAKKQRRKGIKAQYGIEYISKNKGLNNGR